MNTFTKAAIVATTLTMSMGANANSLTDEIERAVKEAATEALSVLVSSQKASITQATKAMFESSVEQQSTKQTKKAPNNENKGDDNDA
ncbi:hypothetical protein AAEU32_11770 [Pseudoalteromonas sp. SSDWG2]|uniref:hypothetical protein n=1 Tax=Pseudoalteromonas sp. SSDWG2 TaxID=3139391 RepID=UPI003BAA0E07